MSVIEVSVIEVSVIEVSVIERFDCSCINSIGNTLVCNLPYKEAVYTTISRLSSMTSSHQWKHQKCSGKAHS